MKLYNGAKVTVTEKGRWIGGRGMKRNGIIIANIKNPWMPVFKGEPINEMPLASDEYLVWLEDNGKIKKFHRDQIEFTIIKVLVHRIIGKDAG